MRSIHWITFCMIIITLSGFVMAESSNETTENKNEVNLHMFYGQGCPHCANLRLFLDEMKEKYPSLNVYEHEVYNNQEERDLFVETAERYNSKINGVPTLFIDRKMISGFSNQIGKEIESIIQICLVDGCTNPIPEFESEKEKNASPKNNNSKILSDKLTIPIVISAAAVDAINPCAFAVLIILMTAALSITNKKRALKFGFAFTISIYISYFLIGLGLFSALQATGLSHNFYIIVTILAVIVGLLNIKDYFWYGKGFLMEVPLSWRPAMKKLLKGATSPFGAFIVGFAVSLFELPCTGGPYIVIMGLLAKEVTRSTGILYLLLYNLVFVAPLIILSIVIYKGVSTTEKLESIRQKKIRLLHLIAGILMLGIAAVMILSIIKGWV